jgi:type VI secretion system secreted protein VgrG
MRELPHISIESATLGASNARVFSLRGQEAISRLFQFEVGVISPDETGLDEDAVLSQPAELVFERGGNETRRLYGIVSAVHDSLQSETQHRAYTLTFVPRAWRLTLNEVSAVYVDQAVPDVIRTKLAAVGLQETKDFELRLDAAYGRRECIVQYKESDLQFVSRLCEHLGIAFFFEHDSGRDRIVFSDQNRAFREVPGRSRVPFHARGERLGVFHLDSVTRTLPARVIVKDYNYRTPGVSLLAQATVVESGIGDVIEYGVHCKTPAEAAQLATVRAEELRCGRRVYSGQSTDEALTAGATYRIDGHPRGDVDVLVTAIEHVAQQTVLGTGPDDQRTYENSFRAIPKATTFRPPRTTPKPRVAGAITGIVEAEQAGDYAELDDTGRYHVRFLFDTAEPAHGKASHAVRMAQPHAGAGYGFHFPLRDGVEVILTCIEGDPDRPIISGAVPNPVTPSTVGAKNAQRNVIRTGGGTEINIDDSEGGERLKITVPFGETVLQLGAPNQPVPGALIKSKEKIHLTSLDQDLQIFAATEVGIRSNNAINAVAPFIDLHGISKVRVGAPLVEVNGDAKIAAGAPEIAIGAGAVLRLSSGATAAVHGKGSLTLTSGGQLAAGAPTITIKADGVVTVSGATVNVEGGTVNVKAGAINLNS